MPRLIAKDGKVYEILQKKTSIGRIPSNDIYLKDAKISRSHAQIIFDGQHFYMVDNMSLNGTYVNGIRIDEVRLTDGDEIEIGNYQFNFEMTTISPHLDPGEGDTVFHFTRSLDHVRAREDEASEDSLFPALEATPEDPHALRISHRNLEVLRRLSRAINNTLELETQLESAAEMLLDSLPGRMVSISLLDELGGKLVPHIVHTIEGREQPPYAFIDSLAQRAIKDQVCVATFNPREGLPEGADRVGSAMTVPLWIQEKVVGLIYLENDYGEKPYSEPELDLLIAMAGTIAPAVQNAGLYRQVLGALEQIHQQQRQLVQSEKLAGIGTLAAGVAHEINNPLAGIMGMAEAVMSAKTIEKAKEYAKEIVHYSENAARIVRDLQNYARVVPEDPLNSLNIEDVIEDALRLATHSGLLKMVKVHRNKENISCIMAEPSQLGQVFINLIQNAVQAMGGKGEITISTWMEDDKVFACVKDAGPGISSEHIGRIFDPFFSTKKEGEGTGLGLAVTLRIVSRFGATITCDSSPGNGTTFTLCFPAEKISEN